MASARSPKPGPQTIVVNHTYDAPRGLVFKAWIEPKDILRWFYASEGWTTPYAETDPRPGGAFRIGFHSPDGADDFAFEGVYNEVVEPEWLAFTISDGRPVTVTFADDQGKTRLALELTLEDVNSEEQQRQGWSAMLDHLADYLAAPAAPDLVITRVFDAPRQRVWEAWTDPKQMAQWWGPHSFTNPVCEMDVRPGGAILIHMKGPDGLESPMKGVFQEVVRSEKLVFSTSAFHDEKGIPGIESLDTVTFTEHNGKTTMRLESRFTKAKPEFALAISGHKAGWNQSLDRLTGLLSGNPEFVITRLFDAPRDLVWKAYTEPERLAQWWGPKGYKMLKVKLDLRPGGAFHYGMQAPDGATMWGRFVYREIDAPERLSFVVSFSDENAGITRHPMSATWPLEVLSTVTFFEIEGKTALIMSGMPINATDLERKTYQDGRKSMEGGFKGTLDQLEEYLKSTAADTADREIVVTRLLDAPRERVWKAWTDPQQIVQWWGPNGFTTTTYEMDVRPGGVWKFMMHSPDGVDYPNKTVFIDVAQLERLVYKHGSWDDDDPGQFVSTVTFTTHGRQTEVTIRSLFASAAERQMVVEKYNAIEGGKQTLARLAEYVVKI